MNKLIFRLLSVFVMFILVIGSSYSTYGLSIPQSQVTTLPVTEGFGANPIGGQGGTAYAVTNTNDSGSGNGIPAPSGGFWYRGNTHTHSQLPDLDDRSTIAGWYKTAGYDFLMISDHNYDVNQQNYCPDNLSTATFLMICGVELSNDRHVTALGINQYIGNESSLQSAVTLTLNAGGVPFLNHPQDPVISASTFLSTTGLNHLEIVNGGRLGQTPASEALWDVILSASNGRLAYGVAADDNHYTFSQAFKGWIVVRANALTKADILASVRAGNFYASTGIVLNDYVVDFAAKTITVDSQNGNTITFIGNNGAVLQSVSAAKATYLVTGLEKYVRAKITNTAGKMAWTQPIYVTSFGEITPTPTTSLTPPSITNTPTLTRTPTRTPILTNTPIIITTTITPAPSLETKHYTANETRADGSEAYTDAAAIGFTVHDAGMGTDLNALPAGSQAMVWVGIGASNCSTTLSSTFTSFVLTNAANPKLYGFYLTDEPLNDTCVAAVTAYTKYIHDNAPGKKAFILLTDWPGTYAAYRPAVTNVDLIGLDPYPVKDGTYDNTLIPNQINNAMAAGIPLANIVPVFQTFGGAGWDAPTATQLTTILGQWATLVPNPPLDYAYSWGTQSGYLTDGLVNRADWRDIMAAHNQAPDILAPTFADVPLTYWAYSYIERLYNAGITGGCGTNPLIYCPGAIVTRAQMAVFLLSGLHGSAYVPPNATGTVFTDVAVDSFAAAWIEQLYAEGITAGCGTGFYCPNATVTRAQMAVFLLRTKHGSTFVPPQATGIFTDVPVGSFGADYIEQLALEGITGGCGPSLYCPAGSVTRAEMAVFLVRAFNLP